jgi:glycosyltransferase involved in cell wall biosynthesis
MRGILSTERPDVVHVHNLFPLISPSVLPECRRASVPVLMTVHNYRLVCPNGLHLVRGRVCEKCCGGREFWCVIRNCLGNVFKSTWYALRNCVARKCRFFLDNVDAYAALTDFQRRRLVQAGIAPGAITVVPNMASVEGAEAPPPVGEFVGYVGRISPDKGMASLVAAARNCPDIPFKAAGAHHAMPRLLQQAPPNLQFLGHLGRENLAAFYRSARMIVVCSICFEGFPTTILEAMAHRKPVVCSRIGALPGIVEDGQTGLVFEPGSATDMAEKIRQLWERPDLCCRMGNAGRRKAMREYSKDTYYERLLAAYRKAMDRARQRTAPRQLLWERASE